jgi:hypothetical protein
MRGLRRQKNDDRPAWMVVYVTQHMTDAQIVAGRLQHEGIPAFLDHIAGRDAIGLTIGAWGEVKVLVHPADYDAAFDLLHPEEPPELPDQVQPDDVIIYREEDDHDDDE